MNPPTAGPKRKQRKNFEIPPRDSGLNVGLQPMDAQLGLAGDQSQSPPALSMQQMPLGEFVPQQPTSGEFIPEQSSSGEFDPREFVPQQTPSGESVSHGQRFTTTQELLPSAAAQITRTEAFLTQPRPALPPPSKA
ncbi:hypothetical protein SCLCIDRAFT_23266 [Scleroderma citrinum Foug A]|uniref:Uncharacterized protein n=1 Tax=Scleroderma citrinum Foug A TaxID=1036808 RepID=A0A0C3AJ29_9AGAM|nr:hypothetical protein SCLCIDRAFT_23266 [Scleroderma citrinum Foug A]